MSDPLTPMAEVGQAANDHGASRRARTSTISLFESALLAIPALWVPARLVANNLEGVPRLERLITYSVALWLVCLGIAYLAVRLGAPHRPAIYTVFVVATGLTSFGGLARQRGTLLAMLIVVALAALVAWLTSRFEGSVVVSSLTVALAVAMISGPVVGAFGSWARRGVDTSSDIPRLMVEMSETPDIFVVVLDGYPGSASLAVSGREGLDADTREFLINSGFQIPRSAWSSYPVTKLSVSSLIEMGYPATEWVDNSATTQTLYDTISGENNLLEVLKANGYQTSMVENAWSGSSCRDFEECIAAPLHDSAFDYVLNSSILGSQKFSMPGFSFAKSTQANMETIIDLAAAAGQSEQPQYVFAHLLAPHPPLFLTGDCSMEVDATRRGFFYTVPGVSIQARDAHFAEQLSCVGEFVERLVDNSARDAVVVLVADHGIGRSDQLIRDPESWSEDDMVERMNVFVAVRADECDIGDPVVTPNIMRRVLSCYSNEPVPDVTERMFLGPETELAAETLEQLVTVRS